MSTYQTDPRVDAYIQTLPDWQQELCRQVRGLVHEADPEVTETIKRTKQPYFTLHGNNSSPPGRNSQPARSVEPLSSHYSQ